MANIPAGYEIIPDGYELVPDETPKKKTGLPQPVRDALGGLEAVGNMVAGIPGYIGSGYAGLGDVLTGNLDKAGNRVESFQQQFMPQPKTPEGQQVMEALGTGIEKFKEKGHGDNPLINSLNDVANEITLNLLPFPGGKAVRKGGQFIEERLPKAKPEAKIPEGYELVPAEAAPVKEPLRADPIQNIVDSQLSGWNEPLRPEGPNGMETVVKQLEASKQQQAQALLEQRQREIEMDVARQTTLDSNAAQRARQEAAPTGYQEHVERVQDEANSRLPAEEQAPVPFENVTPSQGLVDPYFKVPKSQRGAIDLKALEDGFNKFRMMGDNLLQVTSRDGVATVTAHDPSGKVIGEVRLSPTDYVNPSEKSNLESMWTKIDPQHRGTGLAEEMYKFGAEQVGDIIPAVTQTDAGRGMWNRFERTGTSKGMKIPRSQRGAIDLGSPEPKGDVAKLTPESPEVVEAKKQFDADRRREMVAKIVGGTLESYKADVDSPEKVIALASSAKDLGKVQAAKAKTISPGINSVAISSNNPLVKFARDSVSRTIRQTEKFTRQYVTGPDGFGAKLKKLDQSEQNAVVGALQYADRKQQTLTPEALKENGFNQNQIDFIQHVQKMDEVKLQVWNKVREQLGLPLVKERAGHFAGNFDGDYRTLVFDKDKNIVGVITTNTAYGNAKIRSQVKAKDKNLTFAETKRGSLGGSGPKASIFTGFNDILNIISKDDPRFAKIQEVIDAAIKDRGDSLYGASLHAESKKGIWGNEGNKPWLDKNENTKAALKSFVDYWENGIASHLNLPTEVALKEVMDNPALDHMPNAKQYVDKYIQNYTGRSVGTLGDSINKIIDAPFRYTGLGPTVPRNIITQFNKRASQFTMGFVNPLFLLTQYLQLPQMGVPEMIKLGEAVGKSPLDIEASMSKTIKDGLKLALEEHTGKKTDVDQFTRDAYQYAQDNGLLTFSEYANARDIFQNKASKAFDQVADYAREKAEQSTRPVMFLATVDLLKNSGMSPKQIYDTAYNVTQHAMVNYHQSEKPLMYGRLGVLGNAAGSLQTFKHAYLGQMGTLIKDAAKGSPGPLGAALVALLAFSGIKGVPFYQEADELVKAITDKYFSDRKSIADLALKNFPEWSKSGALSTLSGVNMQSRLSAADVLPNSPLEAVSPFASWAGKIGEAGFDVAKNNDELAWSNLATAVAPSGTLKGLTENAVKTNEDGSTINRTGERDYPRTERDTAIRKYTGGSSLDESLAKSATYEDSVNQKSRQDAQKNITKKAQRMLVQGSLTEEAMQEFMADYVKEKGDPQQLVDALVQYAQTMNLTTKQRLEGTPSGLSSVHRYQNYNN
jgi:hypothetical protein